MVRLDRREFLMGSAALATGLPAGQAVAGSPPLLTARESALQLVSPVYPPTRIWSYEGSTPGPVIRATRGERLSRRLVNELPEPTTVHWHGIRIENAMDGIPGLTQEAVAPGGRFDYDFALEDAGTYWYHPHVRSWEQVARGLSGALIVDEEQPPEVDREEVLLLDDWRLDSDAQIDESFGSLRDWSHAGRIGNLITVNGIAEHGLKAARNERIRLRLINAANARIFDLGLRGMEGWIVALDGQPLEEPVEMRRMRLAPAQRMDLIVDVVDPEEAFLISFERDGGYALTTVSVDAPLRQARQARPQPLQPNAVPPLGDLDGAVGARLRMDGGAMGGMASAIYKGEETDIRELAGKGLVWAFNGEAVPTEGALIEARLGQTVRVEMANETRWPHAMHLHGHHFRPLNASGQPGPLRDTLLMDPGQKAEIAFVADNPGEWLFHCHMLEHAAGGMSTWIRVTA